MPFSTYLIYFEHLLKDLTLHLQIFQKLSPVGKKINLDHVIRPYFLTGYRIWPDNQVRLSIQPFFQVLISGGLIPGV